MDGDLARMGHYFIVVVDERRPKIDEDVDDKHDVHCDCNTIKSSISFHFTKTP